MNPEEIKVLIETTIKGELEYQWLYVLLSGVFGLFVGGIIEYVKTKGKNIATKQDIEELTRKIEVVKGGQQLRYKKINEFYDKTIALKALLLTIKNEASNEVSNNELFERTKGILKAINSDVIFSKVLLAESQIIEDDYNSWVLSIESSRERGESSFSFDFDKTFEIIGKIQDKVLKSET